MKSQTELKTEKLNQNQQRHQNQNPNQMQTNTVKKKKTTGNKITKQINTTKPNETEQSRAGEGEGERRE